MRVVYGDVDRTLPLRRATFGCHNLALSAFRFTRPGAHILLPHQTLSDFTRSGAHILLPHRTLSDFTRPGAHILLPHRDLSDFTRPGAHILLPHRTLSDSFSFHMSFVTVKPDGVLLSTTVQDSSSPSTHGIMLVSNTLYFLSEVNGKLLLQCIDFQCLLLIWSTCYVVPYMRPMQGSSPKWAIKRSLLFFVCCLLVHLFLPRDAMHPRY